MTQNGILSIFGSAKQVEFLRNESKFHSVPCYMEYIFSSENGTLTWIQIYEEATIEGQTSETGIRPF
jgi:hypothetical protein